jgi:fibronectin type 3 domain-containing protein
LLVELYWTANSEPDLAGYTVYRSATPGAGYSPLTPSPIAGTTYIDPVPGPGTYYYVVTAVDASGNESPFSAEASAAVVDVSPAAPSGLTAAAGDSQVTLAWTASTEPDLAGYNVYRGPVAGGPYSKLNAALVASPGYVDMGLANGTEYYYVVTAVDAAANESSRSAEASATPTAQASTVHVQAIALSVAKVSSKNWQATAAVTIADQTGVPRQGATVVGDWYFKGAIAQSGASGVTDATGKATISSPAKPARTGDVFRFVVTGVTLAGHAYDPAQNVVTEGSVAVP